MTVDTAPVPSVRPVEKLGCALETDPAGLKKRKTVGLIIRYNRPPWTIACEKQRPSVERRRIEKSQSQNKIDNFFERRFFYLHADLFARSLHASVSYAGDNAIPERDD